MSALGGVSVVSWKILGGGWLLIWARMSHWCLVSLVRWRNVPAGLVKVPSAIFCSSRRSRGPCVLAGCLGDPDHQEGEPAQPALDNVGADAFFLAVIDRPQVDAAIAAKPPLTWTSSASPPSGPG